MAVLNAQTPAPTGTAGTPPTPAPAATPSPAGVRTPLGSFGARLAATPRAVAPGTIPTRPAAPAAEPVAQPPTPVVIAPADAARAAATPQSQPAADPPTAADDGGGTPTAVVGRGGNPIPEQAVSDRVARERNRILRAEYGTTDAAEITKIKALRQAQAQEYTTLKQQKDEADRQAMTESQRQAADLEVLRTQNAELQAKIQEMETGQVVSSQTQELTKIAGKYIDPSMLEYALGDFQRYVNKMDPKDVKRLTPRSIERWFTKLAEEKPRFKIVEGPDPALGTAALGATGGSPAPVTPTPKPAVRRVPITTSTAPKGGAPKAAPAKPAAGTVAGKTPRPGQPNSMTPAELKAHLRQQGRQVW